MTKLIENQNGILFIPLILALEIIVDRNKAVVTALNYFAALYRVINSTAVLAKMRATGITASADILVEFGKSI